MTNQHHFFEGLDGERIFYQAWVPDDSPKAAVLLVHGLAEHSGRYANLVEHLLSTGYAVYTFDLVGHGRSEGRRAYVRRFGEYSALVQTFRAMLREQEPSVPFFAFGHSMGAVIAIDYALAHENGFAGLILSGLSAEMPAAITPLTFSVAKVLSALIPTFGVQALEFETLSRDPTVVQGYVSDPLVYTGRIPARTGVELLQAQQRIVARASEIALPVLMVHGGDDRLCPLSGARTFYRSLGSVDKTIKVYDGLYHEVCNEPECRQVLGDIAAWMEARLDGTPN